MPESRRQEGDRVGAARGRAHGYWALFLLQRFEQRAQYQAGVRCEAMKAVKP